MNAPMHTLRLMGDEELRELVLRLQVQVEALRFAQTEIGLRIRQSYQVALDAAIQEQERRTC